jgi:hypothetical protein
MRFPAATVLPLAAVLLSGCGWSDKLQQRVLPDTISLADRCASIMQAAMPFASIDIGDRTSEGKGVRTIVARVTGTRTDLPKDGPGERDLAVECTFENNVLVAFHWTKGGPPSEEESDHPPGKENVPPQGK